MLQESSSSKNHLRRSKVNSNVRKKSIRKNLFHLQDVCVEFDKIQALRNVQLSIESGEILFITGPSGAGKTTLLSLLCSDLVPTKGHIYYPQSFRGTHCFISKVFQDLRLISKWTCEENLMTAYDCSTYASKKDFYSDMMEMAKVLGFNDRLNLKIQHANGGLKQKIAIARALLTKPEVFIADEPTSSLDAENAQRIFDILNLYNTKRGMTVIWASHNKELVKRFTGRIVHLDSGKLVYSGHACFI